MNDLVPDEDAPDLPLLHERDYVVRAYAAAPDEILVRGVIHDVKPPGLLVEGDPEPLTMHHMVVELRVHYPSLDITAAHVSFDAYPQPMCPTIAAHYESLVGLSIARGFTHRVRELFGGPRGCSHTTALLQAMAPVAVQSWFGMARLSGGERGGGRCGTRSLVDRPQCAPRAESEHVSHLGGGFRAHADGAAGRSSPAPAPGPAPLRGVGARRLTSPC